VDRINELKQQSKTFTEHVPTTSKIVIHDTALEQLVWDLKIHSKRRRT